jgi:hypothetical protein
VVVTMSGYVTRRSAQAAPARRRATPHRPAPVPRPHTATARRVRSGDQAQAANSPVFGGIPAILMPGPTLLPKASACSSGKSIVTTAYDPAVLTASLLCLTQTEASR